MKQREIIAGLVPKAAKYAIFFTILVSGSYLPLVSNPVLFGRCHLLTSKLGLGMYSMNSYVGVEV